MPFATPGEVRKEIEKRIETVGRERGLLIASGHMLQPVVPWRNITAFFEAGEKKTVDFMLGADQLSFVNRHMERVVEPGVFEIMFGGLTGSLEVKATT